MSCERCGRQLGAGERFCSACGAPVPNRDESGTVTGPEPSRPEGRRGPRWGLWVAAACAVLLTVTGSAFLIWRHDSGTGVDRDGLAPDTAALSAEPSKRWERSAEQIAPGAGCSSAKACVADAAAIGDNVVVALRHPGRGGGRVVALDRSGSRSWTVKMPSGRAFECRAAGSVLWCLDTPEEVSEAARLTWYSLESGKRLGVHHSHQRDSATEYLAEVTPGAAYLGRGVVVDGSNAGEARFDKVDVGGKEKWHASVTVDVDEGQDFPEGATVVYGLREEAGSLRLRQATSKGREVTIDDDNGRVQLGKRGSRVGDIGGTRVSRLKDATIAVGGERTTYGPRSPGDLPDWLADGRGPLLLQKRSEESSSASAATWVGLDPKDPYDALYTVLGDPLASCGDVLVVKGKGVVRGFDSKTGDVKWERPGQPDTESGQPFGCASEDRFYWSQSVEGFDSRAEIVGVDAGTGKTLFKTSTKWSAPDSDSGSGAATLSISASDDSQESGIVVTSGNTVSLVW